MKKQNLSEDTGVKLSGVATQPVSADKQVLTTRSIGVVALAYAASMIVQNTVFAVTGAVATPFRSFCARAARTRINIHWYGASNSRKRFDETMAATVRRDRWQFTYPGRNWKPRHRGWVSLAVYRGSWSISVALLAHCNRPTTHSWIELSSLYR